MDLGFARFSKFIIHNRHNMRGPSARPYYTLKPFAEMFRTGVPVLMYHKIAQRPRKARLKGLYVAPAVFSRQLAEFRKAGFAPARPAEACAEGAPSPRVVLTFDDGFRNVFQNALEPLARHGLTAILFLVSNLIGKFNEWEMREGETSEPLMDAAEVRHWLQA